jgi:hypothetical protein
MNEYRADLIGKNGHIANSRAFVCANDDHAIVWAKQLAGGDGVELWSGNRFVFRLNAFVGTSDRAANYVDESVFKQVAGSCGPVGFSSI